MSAKRFLLAAVAALAMVLPAQASVILGFRLLDPSDPQGNYPATPSSVIPTGIDINDTIAIPGGGLTMNPGEVAYVAMTLRVTNTTPGPVQNFWNSISSQTGLKNQLSVFGANITFNAAVADNPYIPLGTPPNLSANGSNLQILEVGQGYSNSLPGDPYSAGWRNAIGLTTGGLRLAGTGGGTLTERPLAIFKVVASAPGSTFFTLSQATTGGPAGTPQSIWSVTDGVVIQDMTAEVFAGGNPQLQVTVVPEPSSMALAGLAFAGMGYRKLRRKKVTA